MDIAINWLWQGCAVAVMALVALRVLTNTSAESRHLVCWAALAAVLALPLVAWLGAAAAPRALELEAAGSSAPLLAVPDAWWSSSATIGAVWALWFSVCAIRLLAAAATLRRAKRRCRPFPAALEARLPCWRGLSSVGRFARLRVSDGVGAAAVFGGRTPIIAIAPALIRELAPDDLDRVVIHEWAHVQRRDDLLQFVERAIEMVAGWHPAVSLLGRRLHHEREAACDEIAATRTGSPKSYAVCLLKLATLAPSRGDAALALGVLTTSQVGVRIRRLVSPGRRASMAVSRSAAALAAVWLAAASLFAGSVSLVGMAPVAVSAANPLPVALQGPRTDHIQALPQAGRSIPAPATAEIAKPAATGTSSAPARAREPAPRQPQVAVSQPATVPGSQPPTTDALPTLVSRPIDVPSAAHPALAAPAPAAPPDETAATAPWTAAADLGRAAGVGSANAGKATGRFFTRVGKRIAGSF